MIPILVLSAAVLGVVAIVVVIFRFVANYRHKAAEAGYASLGDYLRSAPRSDQEKRDAVDLALKGLVICVLGLILPPLLLLGVFPLFYGARKLSYASLGLGLVDEVGQPEA